jgi:hypothetical protein
MPHGAGKLVRQKRGLEARLTERQRWWAQLWQDGAAFDVRNRWLALARWVCLANNLLIFLPLSLFSVVHLIQNHFFMTLTCNSTIIAPIQLLIYVTKSTVRIKTKTRTIYLWKSLWMRDWRRAPRDLGRTRLVGAVASSLGLLSANGGLWPLHGHWSSAGLSAVGLCRQMEESALRVARRVEQQLPVRRLAEGGPGPCVQLARWRRCRRAAARV